MGSGSFGQRALKEVLIWMCVTVAGCATFSSFEPLYDSVRKLSAKAGFPSMPAFDTVSAATRLDMRLGSVAALNFKGTLRSAPAEAKAQNLHRVTLSANSYGHFHTDVEINGQKAEFMTDTGATYVALSYETAAEMGIATQNLRFTGRSTTANGVAKVASVVLEKVRVGDISVPNVQAVIAEPGRMSQNLLGMSFISRLSGFELMKDKLVMTQ